MTTLKRLVDMALSSAVALISARSLTSLVLSPAAAQGLAKGEGPVVGQGLGPFVFNGDLSNLPPADLNAQARFEGLLHAPPPCLRVRWAVPLGLSSWILLRQLTAPLNNISAPLLALPGMSGGNPPDTNGVVGPKIYIQTINVRSSNLGQNGRPSGRPLSPRCLPPTRQRALRVTTASRRIRWCFMIRWPIVSSDHPRIYRICASSRTAAHAGRTLLGVHRGQQDQQSGERRLVQVCAARGQHQPQRLSQARCLAGCVLHVRQHVSDSGSAFSSRLGDRQFDPGRRPDARGALRCPGGFWSLLPANMHGSPPPAGAPNVFASVNFNNDNKVFLWNFHVDFVPRELDFRRTVRTYPHTVNVAAYTHLTQNIPQPGTAVVSLDALGDRPSGGYRKIGGTESLWLDHPVDTGGTSRGSAGTKFAIQAARRRSSSRAHGTT